MDTGASCSLIDLGSLETIELTPQIDQTTRQSLIDASGQDMDILGSVCFNVSISGYNIQQEFQILNVKTYKHILLGCNFMSNFETIEFDFAVNKVKLNKSWIPCVSPTQNEQVRLQSKVTLPPRSDNVVLVHC